MKRTADVAGDYNQIIRWVVEHVAVITLGSITAGFVLTTLFLYSYLSVFSGSLIWFIEYTDLIKIGIIQIGAMIFAVTFLQFVLLSVPIFGSSKFGAIIVTILLGTIALIMLYYIYSDVFGTRDNLIRDLFPITSVVMFLICVIKLRYLMLILAGVEQTASLNSVILNVIVTLFVTVIVIGAHYGMLAKNSGSRNAIVLPDRILEDVGVIFFTSHHAAFHSKDGTITVVPSGAIREIRRSTRDSVGLFE